MYQIKMYWKFGRMSLWLSYLQILMDTMTDHIQLNTCWKDSAKSLNLFSSLRPQKKRDLPKYSIHIIHFRDVSVRKTYNSMGWKLLIFSEVCTQNIARKLIYITRQNQFYIHIMNHISPLQFYYRIRYVQFIERDEFFIILWEEGHN